MTTSDSGESSSPQTGGAVGSPESDPMHGASAAKRRRWFRTIVVLALASLIVGAIGIGSAEYYTARPDFCGTCHIMDPYYESWTQDIHGTKLDVWCVECHYAPGQQHTFNAKFRGLSQLASYFSGRAGGSRPRAHVNDASCTRSRCHGDNAHFDKSILIGETRREKRIISGHETEVERTPTVRFVHAKHLDVGGRAKETEAAIVQVAERLRQRLGAEAFAEVESAGRSVLPAAEREAEMKAVMARRGASDLEHDALELMRLEHVRVRLAQLSGLNCAACHSYDASGKHHFAVDRQTCFVCHFTNQAFNHDTGECLKCHEPPTRRIAVHGAAAGFATDAQTAPASAALMDHLDIVNRGIDCASCHFDVIRGESRVSERDCTHCHDQARFTADFASRDTRVVEDYHRVHVERQRARCPDCHRTVEHSLVNAEQVGTSSGFLQPVIDECRHCHPNHHNEQVDLLMGVGGHGIAQAMPNAMFGSRLNCRACHSQAGSDFKGAPLIEATQGTCVACHGEDYRQLFDQWVSEIRSSVEEVEASLARVDARVKEMTESGAVVPEDVRGKIEESRLNLHFVKSGNGIHNKNFALQLLDVSQRNLDAAVAALSSQ